MRSTSLSSRAACSTEKFDDGGGGAVDDDLDVGVACDPKIFEEACGEILG